MRQAYDYWQNQPDSCRAPARGAGLRRPARGRRGACYRGSGAHIVGPGRAARGGRVRRPRAARHPASNPQVTRAASATRRTASPRGEDSVAPRDLTAQRGGPRGEARGTRRRRGGGLPRLCRNNSQWPVIHRSHRAARGCRSSPSPILVGAEPRTALRRFRGSSLARARRGMSASASLPSHIKQLQERRKPDRTRQVVRGSEAARAAAETLIEWGRKNAVARPSGALLFLVLRRKNRPFGGRTRRPYRFLGWARRRTQASSAPVTYP